LRLKPRTWRWFAPLPVLALMAGFSVYLAFTTTPPCQRGCLEKTLSGPADGGHKADTTGAGSRFREATSRAERSIRRSPKPTVAAWLANMLVRKGQVQGGEETTSRGPPRASALGLVNTGGLMPKADSVAAGPGEGALGTGETHERTPQWGHLANLRPPKRCGVMDASKGLRRNLCPQFSH
jgi:hypothetical protein